MKHSFKRVTALFLGFFLVFQAAKADEGMWLPLYLKQLESKCNPWAADYGRRHLQRKQSLHQGCHRIPSVVSVRAKSFPTEGLVFTNHHCGYDAITELSTTEKTGSRGRFLGTFL